MVEEKLKKVTTERAPVAGQTTGGTAGRGFGRQSAMADVGDDALAEALRAAMRDGSGGGAALNEMLRQSAQTRGVDLFGAGASSGSGSGAAAAAGVLTALDEDEEGAEDAQVPGDFEYFTDNDEEEEL